MNDVRILILGETLRQNAIFLDLRCVWVELFEVDRSRFRWLQGRSKTQSFSKI